MTQHQEPRPRRDTGERDKNQADKPDMEDSATAGDELRAVSKWKKGDRMNGTVTTAIARDAPKPGSIAELLAARSNNAHTQAATVAPATPVAPVNSKEPPRGEATANESPPTCPDDLKERLLTPLSIFKDAKAANPMGQTTMFELLRRIAAGTYQAQIEEIREAVDSCENDRAQELKRKLPAVSMSGYVTTGGRGKAFQDGRFDHSGWMQCDFDFKDFHPRTAEDVKAALAADPYIQAAFQSPTFGVKAVLRIPVCQTADEHKAAFLAAERHFKDTHGLTLDPATKDPVRVCFVSYDPAAIVKMTPAAVLPVPVTVPGQTNGTDKRQPPRPAPAAANTAPRKPGKLSEKGGNGQRELTPVDVRAMLAVIPPRPEYDEWLKISSAVWDALGEAEGSVEWAR